jgi:prophage DNA circulation protein
MRYPLRALAVFACAAAVYAQAPQSTPKPGLETPWEIAPVLNEIAAHAERLLPLLDKMDAQAWVAKGASDTYAAQLQSCKEQASAITIEAKALAANPEQLAAALQLVFRIQGLESMLSSVEEGARRYQSQTDATVLVVMVAQGGGSRDHLQRYVVNLAAAREQELKVMDREAQRCRGVLTQAPPKTVGRKK